MQHKGAEKITDVLTPLAASYLFGRSGEAVRTAARKGHVASPFSFWFDGKEIRMLDLKSALDYWGRDTASRGFKNLENELRQMRSYGKHVTVDIFGDKYRILHAGSALVVPSNPPMGEYLERQ